MHCFPLLGSATAQCGLVRVKRRQNGMLCLISGVSLASNGDQSSASPHSVTDALDQQEVFAAVTALLLNHDMKPCLCSGVPPSQCLTMEDMQLCQLKQAPVLQHPGPVAALPAAATALGQACTELRMLQQVSYCATYSPVTCVVSARLLCCCQTILLCGPAPTRQDCSPW
jgi:hypothetical protein